MSSIDDKYVLSTKDLATWAGVTPAFINNLKDDEARDSLGGKKFGRSIFYPVEAVEVLRDLWVDVYPNKRTLDPELSISEGLKCLPPFNPEDLDEFASNVIQKRNQEKKAGSTEIAVTEETPKKKKRGRPKKKKGEQRVKRSESINEPVEESGTSVNEESGDDKNNNSILSRLKFLEENDKAIQKSLVEVLGSLAKISKSVYG